MCIGTTICSTRLLHCDVAAVFTLPNCNRFGPTFPNGFLSNSHTIFYYFYLHHGNGNFDKELDLKFIVLNKLRLEYYNDFMQYPYI